jgi:hypothetical protein
MLVRGRVVYFGPCGAPAIDFVRSLPAARDASPYQPSLNGVVRAAPRALINSGGSGARDPRLPRAWWAPCHGSP